MIIDISTVIPGFTLILYTAFTIFGFVQSREDRSGTPFLLYMGAMTVWSIGSFMMHANTRILTPLIWNRVMVVGLLAIPIVLYYTLVDLSMNRTRIPRLLLPLGYLIYAFSLVLNFLGLIVTDAGFDGEEFFYQLGPMAPFVYILLYTYLILTLITIIREIVIAEDPTNRKRLTPLFLGALVLILGQLANLNESIGRYPIDLAAAAINGILIFYAIYRYRIVHYSQTVQKMLVYFILVMSLAFLYAVLLWLVSPQMKGIDFPHRFLFSLLLAGISALVFQPLRRGAFRTVSHLYLGKRLAFYSSLKAFSESLTSIVELETLVETVAEKIHGTFDSGAVAIFVLDFGDRQYRLFAHRGVDIDEGSVVKIPQNDPRWNSALPVTGPKSIRSGHGPEFDFPGASDLIRPALIIPLKFRDRINGYILIEKPQNSDYYDQMALETLDIFAGQCSIALENAITFERLRNQQKRLQDMNQELTISRNKLEAFFDGITAPISLQDVNYNIVLVNKAAARFFGKPERELVGKKCYQMYFNSSRPCPGCMAQDCMHTQLPFTKELKHEQSETTFSTHFYPIAVPEGSSKLVLEFFHDVTEQKHLREELVQSAKLAGIGTLASGIAHEINNPLAAISATADVILEDPGVTSRIEEYTRDILKCAHDAGSIIRDLNTYSRKDSEDKSEIDIVGIIEAALKMAMRGLNSSGIEVDTVFADRPVVKGNENELQQVFLNLIVNGIQAMHGKGLLTLTIEQVRGHAEITVSDTGEGISPDLLDDIFNPFFTTKEPGRGTGLGLSIVHQILHRHGGRINAVSNPGVLTEMRVLLPLADSKAPTIRFVQVTTEQDLEDVFFLQRKILIGERGYREETIRRPSDNNGFHILAYKGLQPIGTVTCFIDSDIEELPIIPHLDPIPGLESERAAEVDRLAVVAEERGGLAPLGLMMLAYLYARSRGAQWVFLDVFADDKQQLKLYRKIGFEEVGRYFDPQEVTVMVLRHRLNYETDTKRLNNFLRPLMSRLKPRIDFQVEIEEAILAQAEPILAGGNPFSNE